MTEVKIASRTCPDEFGRPRTFHYALTVDTVESDTFSCENYGVRISEESGDTAAIPGITTSAVRIDELLTLLVEHGVSPTALPDVISVQPTNSPEFPTPQYPLTRSSKKPKYPEEVSTLTLKTKTT